MKYLSTFFITSCIFFILTSCNQDLENILVKQGGVWKIDRLSETYYQNSAYLADSVSSNAGTIQFLEDGSGTLLLSGSLPFVFDWFYVDEDKELKLTDSEGTNLTLEVVVDGNDSQEWKGDLINETGGTRIRIISKWNVSR